MAAAPKSTPLCASYASAVVAGSAGAEDREGAWGTPPSGGVRRSGGGHVKPPAFVREATSSSLGPGPGPGPGFDPATVDVILYHGNCLDGALSAALAKSVAAPTCRVQPCWWDDACTEALRGLRVACVDMTPPEPMLWRLATTAGALFVVDHHASALDMLTRCLRPHQFLFNARECGASLVWQWLCGWRPALRAATPPLLPYVRALDLFRWDDDPALAGVQDAMLVSRALDAYMEPTVPSMEAALAQGPEFLVHLRACLPILNRCIDKQVARACASSARMRLAWQPGVCVAMVNTQTFVNFVAHELYTRQPVDVVWAWYCHGPSGRVRVSLRSWGTKFDCAAFAQLFRGGGYVGGGNPNSAGFTCTLDVMRSCLLHDGPPLPGMGMGAGAGAHGGPHRLVSMATPLVSPQMHSHHP
jgi:hypothetical protein